jgi:hypothetical protein
MPIPIDVSERLDGLLFESGNMKTPRMRPNGFEFESEVFASCMAEVKGAPTLEPTL